MPYVTVAGDFDRLEQFIIQISILPDSLAFEL